MSEEDLIELNDSLIDSQYLTFIISDDEFSVPIMRVKEIIEYQSLTRVPMVPDFIAGAVNLRGAVVPVINLAVKFGMQAKPVNRRSCIIIMELELDDELFVLGVLVDKVLQVLDIPDSDIEPAPTLGAKIKTEFIQGMGRIDEKFIIILSINDVLSIDEISVVGRVQDKESTANVDNNAVGVG